MGTTFSGRPPPPLQVPAHRKKNHDFFERLQPFLISLQLVATLSSFLVRHHPPIFLAKNFAHTRPYPTYPHILTPHLVDAPKQWVRDENAKLAAR